MRLPQIAVIGPTQTGKSTIVNLLLGASAAAVSPLAGFTVHAAGFVAGTPAAADELSDVLPGWPRMAYEDLRAVQLEALALSAAGNALPIPVVIWDTPDFDSIHALEYQRAVHEITGLADLHLLVVSKEKYADRSVWRMLEPLAALQRPLIVCLNKLAPDAALVVRAALEARLTALGVKPPIITIEYAPPDGPRAREVFTDAAQRLRSAVLAALAARSVTKDDAPREQITGASGVVRLIAANWPGWTAGIRAEHAACVEWRNQTAQSAAELQATYFRDYVDDPARFDAFRRAAVELLNLLEIPGVAPALRAVRQVVTWPVRRLWAAGRAAVRGEASPSSQRRSTQQGVLLDAPDAILTRLERDAIRRCDPSMPAATVWRAIAHNLGSRRSALLEQLQDAAAALEVQSAADIRAAAAELYEALRQRPALLNSLRAARATADAAGIAVAIKTGGAPLNDLLFAPALLAVTSFLTEGALGSYTRGIEVTLKRQQAAALRERVIDGVLVRALTQMAGPASDTEIAPNLTGGPSITPDELATADAALLRWSLELKIDDSLAEAEARGAHD